MIHNDRMAGRETPLCAHLPYIGIYRRETLVTSDLSLLSHAESGATMRRWAALLQQEREEKGAGRPLLSY